MIRRAVRSVIGVLTEHGATTPRDAKPLEELCLNPKPFMDIERAFGQRDYRPYALRTLRNAGAIQTTDDGRLYLDEGRLRTTKWSADEK